MSAAPTAVRQAQHASRRRSSRASSVAYGAVGVLGELLITLGVLLLAFLVWQLWWTDVEGDRAQAEVVQELGYPEPPVAAAEVAVAQPRYDEPPVLPEPAHGESFGTLTVPRWTGEPARPLSQGTDRSTVLDVLGIGHYEGTAMPGGVGNFALAGHRVTYGKPFNRIEELQVGDPLVVWTPDAWYVYRVTSSQVVLPPDVEVIAPVPNEPGAAPTERYITLTTCHPMFSARERYIVHGVLDHWATTSSGTPAELLE